MGAALEIRTDLASPARLRRLARRERNPRTATARASCVTQTVGLPRRWSAPSYSGQLVTL